jgi:sensor histidine kinase regulating citrate/malate metabolism
LMLCTDLLDQMHGKLFFKPNLDNKGSTFSIKLPSAE